MTRSDALTTRDLVQLANVRVRRLGLWPDPGAQGSRGGGGGLSGIVRLMS
jgi:hypothetical protein